MSRTLTSGPADTGSLDLAACPPEVTTKPGGWTPAVDEAPPDHGHAHPASRTKRREWSWGVPAVLVAAASWGSIGIVTSALPSGADALCVATARMLVGGVSLLLIAARPRHIRATFSHRGATGWFLVAAACMVCCQLAYFSAISRAGVAIAVLVEIGTFPLFTGLFARLGGTPISRRWQLATATAIAGTGLLMLHGVHSGRQVLLGIFLAILTGVACALFTIASTRVIAHNGSTGTTMALVLGTAGLAMSPLLLAAQPPWLLTRTGCAVVLYIGLVATAVAYLLYGYALGVLPVTAVSTLALAEPACATVLAVTLLGETLNGLAGLGLAALAGSLLVMALPDGRDTRRSGASVVDGSVTAGR